MQVLQHALKSTAFVQDIHRFIREYGLERPELEPKEHVIVFDEAQRAWDAEKIEDFYSSRIQGGDLRRSEPDLLIEIADRIDSWSLVLALVGEGQEIHTGEEGGLGQWARALGRSRNRWEVHGPSHLAELFRAHDYRAERCLSLDASLRAQAAADLHLWVRRLLDDRSVIAGADIAARLRTEGFPIYVTRDLAAARQYVRSRFEGERDRRYGLLASSKAKNFERHGLDAGFQATKRLKIAPWFNDEPESKLSCCQLSTVITEFQCQGLELDLPIVCWGDDFWWEDGDWRMRPVRRRQPLVRDAYQLRRNAYRVLLTRGREGLVLFVPDSPITAMDATFEMLRDAGAALLDLAANVRVA